MSIGVVVIPGGAGEKWPYHATPALIFGLCATYIHTVRPPRHMPVIPSLFTFALGCFPTQATSASRSANAC